MTFSATFLHAGYEILAPLHESAQSIVLRARRTSDGTPVILKVVNDEFPSPARAARFRREHEMTARVRGPGVIEVHAIEEHGGAMRMVLEDFGGESLARHVAGAPLDPLRVAAIGARIAEALGRIHALGVIHKDVSPGNVVYKPGDAGGDGAIKLIDFGISSDLSRERHQGEAASVIEGTLAYISPEQTGRMSRAVDDRTDLYSLGATLYHLASGRPPFLADDPLELIYAHIARRPEPLINVDPSIPAQLSAIVDKLLAKTAEERYQSAEGARADLEACARAIAEGDHAPFPLGRRDVSDKLRVPERLYGRGAEIARITSAFERASAGGIEVVLVPGASGVGKSSLVDEVARAVAKRRGFFASGKFDQVQRDAPYAGILSALGGVLRRLLTYDDVTIAGYRRAIGAALGENGRVLADVLPEVELLAGRAPPAPDLPPIEAQNRFNLVLGNFVAALATPERPLVIALDDVQWADAASLQTIQRIASDREAKHLLFIGAHREVDAAHPLALAIRAIERAGTTITTLELGPLGPAQVEELLRDALPATREDPAALARLCFEKTLGNPFFLGQFLAALHREGHLGFDRAACAWRWDIGAIARLGITDNVADLLSSRLRALPETTREALRLAACLGAEFDLDALARARSAARTTVASDLRPALDQGLVVPASEAYKFVAEGDATPVPYRFAHDRVQQAAYALIDERDRADVHLHIGRLLLPPEGEALDAERLFETAGHLNIGRSRITSESERARVARLDLAAGRRAKASAAFEPALRFFEAGLDLAGGPRAKGDLARALTIEAAEAAALTGDLDTMERLTDEALARAGDALAEVDPYVVKIRAYLNRGRSRDALAAGARILGKLGVSLPLSAGKARAALSLASIKFHLFRRSIDDLRALEPMRDPRALAAMRLLAAIGSAIYSSATDIVPLHVAEQIRLTVTYGVAPESAFAFAALGLLTSGVLGDVEAGRRYGELAVTLAADPSARAVKARALFLATCFTQHWVEPLASTLGPAVEVYRAGLDSGDLEYASYGALMYIGHGFYVGAPLAELDREAIDLFKVIRRAGDTWAIERLAATRQAIQNLLGRAPDPRVLDGDVCTEAGLIAAAKAKADRYADAAFLYTKLYLACLFHDAKARGYAAELDALFDHLVGTCTVPHAHAYAAIAFLAAIDKTSPRRARDEAIARADKAIKKLRRCAEHAPFNYAQLAALVEAERSRVAGDRGRAREAYDRAAALAREHGFTNVEAYASELAGRFYLSIDKPRIAAVYLREAHHGYLRWGATAKADDLLRRHPDLLARRTIADELSAVTSTSIPATVTSTGRTGALDVLSVLKASQAISGVIVLEDLLRSLMQSVLESAGAQRGALLVLAERTIVELDQAGAARIREGGPDDPALLSSLVRYVERARERVVIEDASRPGGAGAFGEDPYLAGKKLRSILCMPVLKQKDLLGVLYLENNLAANAFTPERCQLLEILAAQAAISLENALLYGELERRVEERTAALKEALDRLKATQEKLILHEKLASLGMLTSGIAHEIKNPLNFVNNFAELSVELTSELLAELQTLDPDVAVTIGEIVADLRVNAEKIREHGRRADAIVRGMLEHSRTGKSSEPRVTDVAALVREHAMIAYHGMRAQDRACDAAIELDLDEATGSASLVPQEIGRVIVNLVNNAIYAASRRRAIDGPSFSPKVRVSTRGAAEEVEIRVRDNGMGVPKAARDKIYNPFFTTKPAGEGTGLGLSISYDIVAQGHGGSMTLDTAEGSHCELTVVLPRGAAGAARA